MNKDETIDYIDEEDDDIYYCKQCGRHGKSSELFLEDGLFGEVPLCPKCMANGYSLAEDFTPDFWDKLKFFCRKISFYGFRRRWGYFHQPLKDRIDDFFKYDIKRIIKKNKIRREND